MYWITAWTQVFLLLLTYTNHLKNDNPNKISLNTASESIWVHLYIWNPITWVTPSIIVRDIQYAISTMRAIVESKELFELAHSPLCSPYVFLVLSLYFSFMASLFISPLFYICTFLFSLCCFFVLPLYLSLILLVFDKITVLCQGLTIGI